MFQVVFVLALVLVACAEEQKKEQNAEKKQDKRGVLGLGYGAAPALSYASPALATPAVSYATPAIAAPAFATHAVAAPAIAAPALSYATPAIAHAPAISYAAPAISYPAPALAAPAIAPGAAAVSNHCISLSLRTRFCDTATELVFQCQCNNVN